MKLLLTLLSVFFPMLDADARNILHIHHSPTSGYVWETKDYKKTLPVSFLLNVLRANRKVIEPKKVGDHWEVLIAEDPYFEELPPPKASSKPKPGKVVVRRIQPVQFAFSYVPPAPVYQYATPVAPAATVLNASGSTVAAMPFVAAPFVGPRPRHKIFGRMLDTPGSTVAFASPSAATIVPHQSYGYGVVVQEEDPNWAAFKQWCNKEWELTKAESARYQQRAADYANAHPWEVATWTLLLLLVLVIRHYRKKVRKLRSEAVLARYAERTLKETHCRAEACRLGCTGHCQRASEYAPSAEDEEDDDEEYEDEDTVLSDMLAEIRSTHASANDRLLDVIKQAMTSNTEGNSEVLHALQSAHDNLVAILKVEHADALNELRAAMDRAVDVAQASATHAMGTVNKAAETAEGRVVEITKTAMESMRVASIEHAKTEVSMVNALAQTAQKAVDSTKTVLDSLTEKVNAA